MFEPGTDFRAMTAAQVLAHLDALPERARVREVRGLLYRKRSRPEPLSEQIALLRPLAEAPWLTRHDRSYALVAAGHKASEALDRESLAALVPLLDDALIWALTLPPRHSLRKDGVHMRFSILNVLVNAGILLSLDARPRHARQVLECFEGIDPRRASPYLFNSSSNIVKTVGLALLSEPDAIPRLAPQVRAMLDFSTRLRHAGDLKLALLRKDVPARFADLPRESSFIEFERTMRRYAILLDASTREGGPVAQDMQALAEICVAQVTPEQKAAHLEAVARDLAPHWPRGD